LYGYSRLVQMQKGLEMPISPIIMTIIGAILKWLLGLIGIKRDPNAKERRKLQKEIWKYDKRIEETTDKMLDAIRYNRDRLRAKYDDERLQLIEERRILQQRFDDLKGCTS
jgi:DNA gyrase/topoisomerase IV subunit A